ncbi:prepilin-type N-terminal cleavage/methylation domain-containing protein [Marinospirillum perlucidum]|uniref:prepilin-type N-terminal cleavage/methylation domain-containing protein n=1 Tax=Marinospirillum perlucidum TaxID=1982602 RepID=UPI00138FE94E|nr:prepilin-type N-terminal cleavage/methylation domain-containing protein [Marinospirillum perlucidum]
MKHPHSGFSLIEVLVVTLVGGLLLVASTQVFTQLVQYQRQQMQTLRLTERTRLAELALRQDLSQAQRILAAASATRDYPDFTEKTVTLNHPTLSSSSFEHFPSSDWLVINRHAEDQEADFSLWHLDSKTYGQGLAHKQSQSDQAEQLGHSQTLIQGAELLRFRYYRPDSGRWLNADQVSDWTSISGIQFAVLLASSVPLSRPKQQQIQLWGEPLELPEDGRLRQLVTGSVYLEQPP